jgi:hypothetical protein
MRVRATFPYQPFGRFDGRNHAGHATRVNNVGNKRRLLGRCVLPWAFHFHGNDSTVPAKPD